MKKNIVNKNTKGELHGYIETYDSHNNIISRGNFKNGSIINYYEMHYIKITKYVIT